MKDLWNRLLVKLGLRKDPAIMIGDVVADIQKLCRREFSEEYLRDISLQEKSKFVGDAVAKSYDAFVRILGTHYKFLDGIDFARELDTSIHVSVGANVPGWDEESLCERTPPWYLWCRCSIRTMEKKIIGSGLRRELDRQPNGLLKHEII